MTNFIVRRLLQAVILLCVISVALFWLINLSADPLSMAVRNPENLRPNIRDQLIRANHYDKPMVVRYWYWLVGDAHVEIDIDGDGKPDRRGRNHGVLRGDFGKSVKTKEPVTTVIGQKMPDTLSLMISAEVVIVLFALFIGIYSAVRQYSTFDHVFTGCSFVAYSMPVFLVGLMLLYIFALKFNEWGLPHFSTTSTTRQEMVTGQTSLWEEVKSHILPVATISLISIASYSRYIRASMLEVLNSDYIRTARAKGLRERRILFIHGFKNAALPLITLIGMDLPLLLGGAVVTEKIFSWPGMGRLFLDSLDYPDFPVLMGLLMMISTAVVVFQLLTDLVYTWFDPRIRFS